MSEEEKEVARFERGSALSIFSSDRKEDYLALVLALIIALWVYVRN
ncbi:hypothetical protein BMS3Bbin11_00787 [bacterium BMS3Bbin11]|nr:hypothetical protein BMS3Abin11_02163 [bacterium BMS3Abin11]GBE45696.1 hypothetical protein BMS3Bbin11_00787 [bacterium BMS3Bbin11]